MGGIAADMGGIEFIPDKVNRVSLEGDKPKILAGKMVTKSRKPTRADVRSGGSGKIRVDTTGHILDEASESRYLSVYSTLGKAIFSVAGWKERIKRQFLFDS